MTDKEQHCLSSEVPDRKQGRYPGSLERSVGQRR